MSRTQAKTPMYRPSWYQEAADWVLTHVPEGLLEEWFCDEKGQERSLDEVWIDLERTRDLAFRVAAEDLPHALADLYCAAYRWHLACAHPRMGQQACQQLAMVAAVSEVRLLEQTIAEIVPQVQGNLLAQTTLQSLAVG